MSESFSVVPWPQQRSPAAIDKQNAAGESFNLNDHYFPKKYSTMHTKSTFLIKKIFAIKTQKYGNLEILVEKMARHNGVKVTKG